MMRIDQNTEPDVAEVGQDVPLPCLEIPIEIQEKAPCRTSAIMA